MRAIVIEQPNSVSLRDVETPTPGPGRGPRSQRPRRRLPHRSRHRRRDPRPAVGALPARPGPRVERRGRLGRRWSSGRRAGHACGVRGKHLLRELPALPHRCHAPVREVRRRRLHARRRLRRVRRRAWARRAPASRSRVVRRGGARGAGCRGVEGARARSARAGRHRRSRRSRRAGRHRHRLSRLHSPAAVIAYGLREEELELALALGADAVVNVAQADAEAETQRLAGGDLDVVVETAGSVEAIELSTRLAREGGRIVALGIAGHGQELRLPADRIALRDLSLFGSVGYTTAAWARMVALLRERLVELDPIVTHRFPLERFEDAFALMDDRRGVVAKIVLEHAV